MTVSQAPNLTARLGDRTAVASYLRRDQVLLHGHYELLSGLHSSAFIAFSALARDPRALSEVADCLAAEISGWGAEAVVAPSTAGVSLGSALAVRLGAPLHLASLDDHGRPNHMIGAPDLEGKNALLVNDVVTTGRGLAQLAQVVRQAGAEVSGAAWFVSRARVNLGPLLGTEKLARLADVALDSFESEACPLCSQGDQPEPAIDLN